MAVRWHKLFNQAEFEATGLTSRTLKVLLTNLGEVEIPIVRGNLTSIIYADTLLPVNFNDRNPFIKGNVAVTKDSNGDVWLGVTE